MTKVRWGLIGCGDIARKRVATALSENESSSLDAVSRARPELLPAFADQFKIPKRYPDWRELVSDPDIDAVYVATPVYVHAGQTVAALNAGKHVLCEKPMAMDASECDSMIATAKAQNRLLGVAYYRHFYPCIKRIKEFIESGELGTPVVAQMNAFEWFAPDETHPRSWLLESRQSGGGPMMDFGCHRIEVLCNLFGRVKDVKGTSSNALFDRRVEDTAVAVIEFESGTIATVTVTHATREPQDSLTIWGSKGSIEVSILNQGELVLKTHDGEHRESYPPNSNLHRPLIDDFVNAIVHRHACAVPGEVGRTVATIIDRIYSAD